MSSSLHLYMEAPPTAKWDAGEKPATSAPTRLVTEHFTKKIYSYIDFYYYFEYMVLLIYMYIKKI